MMDQKPWQLAIAKFSAFLSSVRAPYEQDEIDHYHEIIGLLETASGEDFSHFKIPIEKMIPSLISTQRRSFSGAPGRSQYAQGKHCEASYFRAQAQGLANYIQLLQAKPIQANPAEALKRVRPPTPASISNTYHIRDSNFVNGSPGASVAQNIGVRGEELQKILIDLRELLPAVSGENHGLIESDIHTIEIQTKSPRPNQSIVCAALESAKSIAENIVGNVAAAGIVLAIKHYLNIP